MTIGCGLVAMDSVNVGNETAALRSKKPNDEPGQDERNCPGTCP